MAETVKRVSESRNTSIEGELRKERIKMKLFIENFRSASLNLRSIPQQAGKMNPHLEKRNRAIKQFKIRVQRGDAPVMREMKAMLDAAYALTVKRGEEVKEMSFDRITDEMRVRMDQTYEEVVGVSAAKKRQMEKVMGDMKELKKKLSAALTEETSWLNDPKKISSLQKTDEAFPKELGMSEYLRANDKEIKELPSFRKEDFSKPQEIGSGSFGKVYASTKKRKEKVALKHFSSERSQDAIYEYMALAGQTLPDTFVLPQATYQIRGQRVDPRFPDESILVEYPMVEGRNPEDFLNNIDPPNPKVKAERRVTSNGDRFDFHGPIRQSKRKASAIQIVYDLASSLESFHEAGFVHQDVKPENIKVSKDGKVYLLDNGEVIFNKEYAEKASGSPKYMGPETMKAYYRGNPKIDIYALGITAYILLTGNKDPFDAKKLMRKILVQRAERRDGILINPESISDEELTEERFMEDPELYAELLTEIAEEKEDISFARISKEKNPFHEANLQNAIYEASPELILVLQKATDADPQKRYASAAEMAHDLKAALEKANGLLADLEEKQKRVEKSGSSKYSREKIKEAEEKAKAEAARIAAESARKTAKQKKEAERAGLHFGTTFKPSTVERKKEDVGKGEKPEISPKKVEELKRRNKARRTEFY